MNRIPTVMMILAGLFVFALYGSGFAYAGHRVFRFLRAVFVTPDNPDGSVSGGFNYTHLFIALCVLYVLSIAAGFIPMDKDIQKHFVWFAWLVIGIGLYLLMFFLFADLALTVGRLTKLIASPMSRNVIIASSIAVFAVTAVVTSISVYNAKQIGQASYDITLDKRDSALDELRIVLISDTHLGYLNDYRWMERIAQEINKLEPDVVFIAGDIFNDNYRALAHPDLAEESLRSIRTKYGVYAALGNHDSGSTYGEMVDFLERSGVTVLVDEHAAISDKFTVIGRTDLTPMRGGPEEPRRDIADVLYAIDGQQRNLPTIVVDHQPGAIDEYGSDIDLILAGHTHAGIFFPATVVTWLMNGERNYGHSQKDPDSPQVIVTSGVGLWGPPFRLGSANEIVSINVSFR